MADKKISQLDSASSVSSGAYFPISQSDTTYKGTTDQIGEQIATNQDFSGLNTTSKKVIGAINEVKGLADKPILTEIDTPAPIMTFNDGGDNIPVNKLLVAVTAQQAGTGTPAPDNVRAITGWSSANITRCGKNLCPYLEQGQLSQTTGEEVASDTVRRSGFIRVEAGQTYVFSNLSTSSTQTNKRLRVFFYDRYKGYISNDTTDLYDTSVNVTIPSGVGYIRFQASGTVLTETNAQVEKGSTPTTYEAYKGITVVIPFGDTYYGGVLDVTNGKLTVTHQMDIFDGDVSEGWTLTSNGTANRRFVLYGISSIKDGTYNQSKTNYLSFVTGTSYDWGTFTLGESTTYGFYIVVHDKSSNFADLATFKTYLSNNNLQLLTEMPTPVVINLTPAQIATLAGLNNIYADCGDIQELEYFNENADEIAKLIRAMS